MTKQKWNSVMTLDHLRGQHNSQLRDRLDGPSTEERRTRASHLAYTCSPPSSPTLPKPHTPPAPHNTLPVIHRLRPGGALRPCGGQGQQSH